MQITNTLSQTSVTAATTTTSIPRWVYGVAGFFFLFGLSAASQQYFQPESMFPGFAVTSPAAAAAAWSVGARSLAQAIALGLALLLRSRQAIGVVLVMRAATELQDLIISLTTGASPMSMGMLIPMFAVIIAVELFAAYTLLRRPAE